MGKSVWSKIDYGVDLTEEQAILVESYIQSICTKKYNNILEMYGDIDEILNIDSNTRFVFCANGSESDINNCIGVELDCSFDSYVFGFEIGYYR